MDENTEPTTPDPTTPDPATPELAAGEDPGQSPSPAPVGEGAPPAPPYAAAPVALGAPGQIRGTGTCILLTIVTLGIYSIIWFYKTHDEMKRHSGAGIGGGLALVLAILVGFVMPYINSSEVGGLYERAGREKPVSGATGLWYFPGCFIIVGPFVWFIKTNGALNEYWRSQGVH